MYTASTALLDTLGQCGVSCIFANFGSDHPGIMEAIAEAKAVGRTIPRIITCPNEMVALSCAHGFAQITGETQAVIVHVECGTQALAGAMHNVARNRAPVLIFAGMTPFSQEGELTGSRNEFIQWLQDVQDQRGIVRGYVKYENELRTGKNVSQIVSRAMQIAGSDPKGPVYLAGAREVMEEETTLPARNADAWRPLAPRALPEDGVTEILKAVSTARHPLVVTSYLGRNRSAVAALQTFCSLTGAGVLESAPSAMNFPHADPLYQGSCWNQPFQNEALASADAVLVIDSDVPWIPAVNRPSANARIFHIDVDPLKRAMTLWYIGAEMAFEADAETALNQLSARLAATPITGVAERAAHWHGFHDARAEKLAVEAKAETLTAATTTALVRKHASADAVFLNEGITNYVPVCDHVAPVVPGSFFTSGASSLGWHGGAAIGMKLARPEAEVIAFTGDGSFMFSVPSTVYWMARRYETPFLTVVFNNRGWNAPRFSALAVHPDGYASRANDLDISFDPPPDYAHIAEAAGNALALSVRTQEELDQALPLAFRAIREEKRAAVLDVWL